MSRVYYNQTNITPGTSQFITRAEVLSGLSTFVGDLSGFNVSTLFNNPNPTFSTITMNPAGVISLPQNINTQTLNFSTISRLQPIKGFGTNFNAIGVALPNGSNYTGIYAGGFVAAGGTPDGTTVGDKIVLNQNQLYGITAAGATQNLMTWVSGNPAGQNFSLTNISSINGLPPNTNSSNFTSLTGSNITMTGTLLSPQIINLSSINGFQYAVPYNAGWSGGGSISIPTSNATLCASITLPPNTLQPGGSYIYDVPVNIGTFPSGSPSGFNLVMGIRLGANGQINYQTPIFINAASQNTPLSLTGINQTNPVSVGSQTIDIIAFQNSGATFNPQIISPSSGGGLNIYTIKPLS